MPGLSHNLIFPTPCISKAIRVISLSLVTSKSESVDTLPSGPPLSICLYIVPLPSGVPEVIKAKAKISRPTLLNLSKSKSGSKVKVAISSCILIPSE